MARFDEQIGSSLANFTVIALRTEAATSSQIENLSASASSIAVAEQAPPSATPRKSNEELIAANVATLAAAVEGTGPLSADEIVEIQRVLLEDSALHVTGGFRTEQVWVGGDPTRRTARRMLRRTTNGFARPSMIWSGSQTGKTWVGSRTSP